MSDEPCDVGPVEIEIWGGSHVPQRHHPNGIEPPDEERDRRAQRRAAERNLMDFYTSPADYIAACDAMKPSTAPDYTEAGETFARLIAKG